MLHCMDYDLARIGLELMQGVSFKATARPRCFWYSLTAHRAPTRRFSSSSLGLLNSGQNRRGQADCSSSQQGVSQKSQYMDIRNANSDSLQLLRMGARTDSPHHEEDRNTDFIYPWFVPLNNGCLLVLFYYGEVPGRNALEGMRMNVQGSEMECPR